MKKKIETMNNYELSRWLSLFYAVNLISNVSEEKKIKFAKVHLKPIALDKFVNSMSDGLCKKMEQDEMELVNVK